MLSTKPLLNFILKHYFLQFLVPKNFNSVCMTYIFILIMASPHLPHFPIGGLKSLFSVLVQQTVCNTFGSA